LRIVEHLLRLLKFGSAAWNGWREEHPSVAIALDEAKLDGMILIGINFSNVSLRRASLHATNLMNADLRQADLTGANLSEADLIAANLSGATLSGAQLWEADFLGASIGVFRYWFQPLMRRATMVLHATDAAFDIPPICLPGHHHYAGPLLWEPTMVAPEFLRTPGPRWVLVSVSTLPQAGEVAIAQAAVRALRHEGLRVLVTVAPDHAAELGELPEHVYLSGYVPHSAVMAASRLIISHAGHGIVMKALYYGVPMVLVPWGRDQPGVAARAEALGVAAVVRRDACNDASVAQALRQVLDNAHFTQRARAISKRLQVEDAVAEACAQIELFGSSAIR